VAEEIRTIQILMFTGIIEGIRKIEKIEGNRFTVVNSQRVNESTSQRACRGRIYASPTEISQNSLKIGESIAVSGVCLTVLEAKKNTFTVEIMQESRKRTTFGSAKKGDVVNLERAAIIGARNSGHFVTGHIDEVGKILKISKVDDYRLFRIGFSSKNARLVVEKGSVAVDGISLTVSGVGKNWFEVAIISHTWNVTNLSRKKVGDGVNLEFDVLGKYIAQTNQSFLRKQESSK